MTVQELIDILSDLNPDAQVEMMHQPHYPLRSSIAMVTTNIDVSMADEDVEEPDGNANEGDETVVYLLEGSQLGYGARAAWAAERR